MFKKYINQYDDLEINNYYGTKSIKTQIKIRNTGKLQNGYDA